MLSIGRYARRALRRAPFFVPCGKGAENVPISININVDTADIRQKTKMLQDAMTAKQFERAMYGIYRRLGRHVSQILKKDLPNQYHVKKKDIGNAVKSPKFSGAFGNTGCVIPVRDKRGTIGGKGMYTAKGGARGWESLTKTYRVRAKVVKGADSTLPVTMPESYSKGRMKPFRNLSAPKLNNLTFVREGKPRLPIRKVTGIGIPQMPLNRSEEDVQKDIQNYLSKELERRYNALMRIGK